MNVTQEEQDARATRRYKPTVEITDEPVWQVNWGDIDIALYIENGIQTVIIGETPYALNVERLNGGMLKIRHLGDKSYPDPLQIGSKVTFDFGSVAHAKQFLDWLTKQKANVEVL